MVVCPHCNLESSDAEFCDHCNREFSVETADARSMPAQILLKCEAVLDCSALGTRWPDEGHRSVRVSRSGRWYRLHALSAGFWSKNRAAVDLRAASNLPILAPIEVFDADGGVIVVAEASEHDVASLDQLSVVASKDDSFSRIKQLLDTCRILDTLFRALHDQGLVWLNFDPRQIETDGSRWRITNLDLGLYRVRHCPPQLRISHRYSPPEVCNFQAAKIGLETDVFHLGMYAYYWLAELLVNGIPGGGLEAFSFEIPPLRIYQPKLPPGIWPVVAQGIASDPARRFPNTRAFVDELASALDRVQERYGAQTSARYDVGGTTRAGRAKSAIGATNQDSLWFGVTSPGVAAGNRSPRTHTRGISSLFPGMVLRLLEKLWIGRHPQVETDALPCEGLVIVADGVTHCNIGTGELASQTACRMLADTVMQRTQELRSAENIDKVLIDSCVAAGKEIVRLALVDHVGQCDDGGEATMSSTVVLGLLAGRTLYLANVGDSRMYLATEAEIEQLTVDGDIRCAALAQGAPPEDVIGMGTEAKALRYCLGATSKSEDGKFVCDAERCTPQVSNWPLLPGDVLVFCSDGLVDEGVFLEPHDVKTILAENAALSAQSLAERLVEAADRLQREPSPGEPAGFGDNIACIVGCDLFGARVHAAILCGCSGFGA